MLSRGRHGLDTWTTIPGVQSVLLCPVQSTARDTRLRRHGPRQALSVSEIYPLYEARMTASMAALLHMPSTPLLSHPSSPCRPRIVSRE